MLSSATRKLRFWKKQPDKKKEVTTEDEALLDEIEQQRRIIGSLREECARLKEVKFSLDQYKLKCEHLERRSSQQTRNAERQQSKLQSSLKMAKDEIERLSEDLRVVKNATCGKCDSKAKDHQMRFAAEIENLQETVARLERENRILQSLVHEYTSQASRASRTIRSQKMRSTPNNPNDSSQTSIRSEAGNLSSTKSALVDRELGRSSLSLNDFLDDSVDDIQSEKFEADKSSGCSSLDETQNDSSVGSDFWQDVSEKASVSGREVGIDECVLAEHSSRRQSKDMENSESLCSASDVSSCANVSSVDSSHDLSSAVTASTRTLEKSHSSDTIRVGPETLASSCSLKNLSRFSEQETVVSISKRNSNSSPGLCLEDFSDPGARVRPAGRVRKKKRRSLEDPKTLSKIYLENKLFQTDLQKAINFFRSANNCDESVANDSKSVVMTKDRVAALREYFEGKNANASRKFSPITIVNDIQQIKKSAVQQTETSQDGDRIEPKTETTRKIYSIPRLNGFHRIVKGKSNISGHAPSGVQKPSTRPHASGHPRDVRSTSVPSPILPKKCKESLKFKIAVTKSTSLKSFNHFALNGLARPDSKANEAKPQGSTRPRKTNPVHKIPLKIPLKSSVIADLDKYKLNCHHGLSVVRENVLEAPNPVLVVDVGEDASDSCVSNDETVSGESSSQASSQRTTNIREPTSQHQSLNGFKGSPMKRTIKTPLQNNHVITCQCRTKAQAIKEGSACKLSKPKVACLRTNGSVVQKNPANGIQRSAEDKAPNRGGRVVQKDDSETNQTFFCEVAGDPNSPMTFPKSPVKNNSKPTAPNMRLPELSLSPHPNPSARTFSPEKFILRPDPPSQPRTFISKKPGESRPQNPTPNKSLQPSQQKTCLPGRAPGTQRDRPKDPKRSVPQGTTDKHWFQCARTNLGQNHPTDCAILAPNSSYKNITKKLVEKQTVGINKMRGDTFKEISQQLDELTSTANSTNAKRTPVRFT